MAEISRSFRSQRELCEQLNINHMIQRIFLITLDNSEPGNPRIWRGVQDRLGRLCVSGLSDVGGDSWGATVPGAAAGAVPGDGLSPSTWVEQVPLPFPGDPSMKSGNGIPARCVYLEEMAADLDDQDWLDMNNVEQVGTPAWGHLQALATSWSLFPQNVRMISQILFQKLALSCHSFCWKRL